MDLFNKITISQLIWYLVPGLGLIFFFLFPLLVFKPHVAKLFFETIGPFGIIILGIILGFSLDGLRLYRFRPNYSKIKNRFFQQLQATIDPDLDPYFIQSHINDVARIKNVPELSLHHAIWIMLGQFTILGFLETLFWLLATLYFRFYSASEYLVLFGTNVFREVAIMLYAAFAVLFLFIGFRFLYISTEDQKNTNKMFSNFAEQHRDEIRQLLNVTPRD